MRKRCSARAALHTPAAHAPPGAGDAPQPHRAARGARLAARARRRASVHLWSRSRSRSAAPCRKLAHAARRARVAISCATASWAIPAFTSGACQRDTWPRG